MLLQYNLAPRLGKIYAAGHKVVGVSLNWNPDSELVTVANQPLKSRFWTAVFGLIIIVNMKLVKKLKAEQDIASMSFGIFVISAAAVSMYYNWYFPRKSEEIAKFLNGLLFLEKQQNKGIYLGIN